MPARSNVRSVHDLSAELENGLSSSLVRGPIIGIQWRHERSLEADWSALQTVFMTRRRSNVISGSVSSLLPVLPCWVCHRWGALSLCAWRTYQFPVTGDQPVDFRWTVAMPTIYHNSSATDCDVREGMRATRCERAGFDREVYDQ